MECFNKTKAAVFPMQIMLPEFFPFSQMIVLAGWWLKLSHLIFILNKNIKLAGVSISHLGIVLNIETSPYTSQMDFVAILLVFILPKES